VPSSTVKQITSQLITTGKASHPYIGIYLTDISNSEASDAGIASGIEITKVKSGSPGDSAGLKASTRQTRTAAGPVTTGGDFITAINGQTVTTANQLISRISTMKPGDKVDLTGPSWRPDHQRPGDARQRLRIAPGGQQDAAPI